MELTTPHTMIRFVGNNLHETDYTRSDAWVKRIKNRREKGLKTPWFFVHQLDGDNSTAMYDYNIRLLNMELGVNLQPPRLIK